MLFQNENKFLLIRDTEETKNKEVVFDELGTEGIYIDGEPSTMQDYDSESMEEQSVVNFDWKRKWIPIEVNKNQATAVDSNGANK